MLHYTYSLLRTVLFQQTDNTLYAMHYTKFSYEHTSHVSAF